MDYHTGIAELDQGLDERFEILSPTMRHLLKGDAIPSLVQTLAERFQLTEDMRVGTENEIVFILMHLEPVDDFAANLVTEYLVPPEAALEIEKEVTEKLFAPLMNELGHSSELETTDVAPAPIVPPAVTETAPPPIQTSPATPVPQITPVPNPTPAPHVPVARVMPHSQAEAQHDPRASTELPNALLQNLKASLMHDAPGFQGADATMKRKYPGGIPEEPLEGTNPTPSYNAILSPKTTTPPLVPPNSPPNP